MADPRKRKLALDTNLLFDLADEQDFAHTFRESFQGLGYYLCIPPQVVQELGFWAVKGEGAKAEAARVALGSVRDWHILPFDLISVGHGITEGFANCLTANGLLPDREMNDGQILAETSLAEIPGLVTSDKHLLDIDEDRLRQIFKDRSLDFVQICHPREMLKAIGVKPPRR